MVFLKQSKGDITSLPTSVVSKCRLVIKSVKVTDAAPVEFIGKNDLFVEISCGSIKYRSITQNDVGANALFELGERATGIFSSSDISTLKLEVKLWDENTARSNTLIGTSDPVEISKLLETIGDVRSFPFKVQDAKKKVTGSIVVMAVLSLI